MSSKKTRKNEKRAKKPENVGKCGQNCGQEMHWLSRKIKCKSEEYFVLGFAVLFFPIMKVVKQECTVHPKKLEINEYIVYEIN